MKKIETNVKQGIDDQVARLEQQIEQTKGSATVYDAVQHEGETEDVQTTAGITVINEGDYLFSSGDRVMVIPKAQAEDPALWTDVEE
jgi:hypothetical protein